MSKVTALSGVKLGALIDKATRDGVPPSRFMVKDAFLELAHRDVSRGGGPLDEVDVAALEGVDADPTLAELLNDGERMRSASNRIADLVVALVGGHSPELYLCDPPIKH